MQPAALAVRFLLELLGLVALGLGGYHATDSEVARWLLALAVPAVAAGIWGVFRIPDDPKPAPVAVPGPVRLLIEACFFGGATAALVATGPPGARGRLRRRGAGGLRTPSGPRAAARPLAVVRLSV